MSLDMLPDGAVKRIIDHADETERIVKLADARWYLLQTLVEGMTCVNPQQYGVDCGECIVCACRYRDGALKIHGDKAGLENIPGTREKRELATELRAQYAQGIANAKARHRGFA